MNKCIKCGSYAFNLHKDDIDQGGLCDVHYWQGRAHRAEAKQEQGEPIGTARELFTNSALERLDLRPSTKIYTTPQQRPWVGLTDEQMRKMCGSHATMREAVREAESILKESNT